MGVITGKHTVYETPWFQLESKEVDGDDEAPFYALNLSDYVGVFAIHSDDRILLVKQYRPAVERETLEFVAGHVEHGETPKEAAMRELREETGYRAATWTALGSSWLRILSHWTTTHPKKGWNLFPFHPAHSWKRSRTDSSLRASTWD